MTTLEPMFDRVLIEKTETDDKTASGLFIPPSAKEKPMRGTVIAVGKGRVLDNGNRLPMSLQVGDQVLFGKYSGTTVMVDGRELLTLLEGDVFSRILEEG